MVIALLAACTGRGPMPNTIDGVQIVAIRSVPAQPSPTGAMELEVWVADAHRRGSDVLLWTCTPVDGECLEARPPGTDGLPFPLWTKVLQTTDRDPSASTSVAWPFFQAAAGVEGGIVPVWAAACTPGVCPLVDQIAANPLPGSEAWEAAAQALAAPEAWVAQAPEGSSSVAVKLVPLRSDVETETQVGINENPRLTELATDPESPVHVFGATDNDGDKLEARAFVTAGGVDSAMDAYGNLTVTWFPPADIRVDQDRFVVVTDGRGGTAVWTNHEPVVETCTAPVILGYGQDDAPLPPGAPLQLVPYPYGTVGVYAAYLGFQIEVAGAPRDVVVSVTVEAPNGNVVGTTFGVATLSGYDPDACAGTVDVLLPVIGGSNLDVVCRLGGRSVNVISSVSTYSYSYSSSYGVTNVVAGFADFTQEQVLALPADLPCSL